MIRLIARWIALLSFSILIAGVARAQPEYVPLSHPIYSFLNYLAVRGDLPYWSTAQLPVSRARVRQWLQAVDTARLPQAVRPIWRRYYQEFAPLPSQRRTIFPTASDTLPLFWDGLAGDAEKFVVYYQDTVSTVALEPLGSLEGWFRWADGDKHTALLAQGGFRVYGDFEQQLGYFLQITNGTLLDGDRSVALQDPMLRKNVKFSLLRSDFDFTESHVRYRKDWFFIDVGRMRRKLGAGVFTGLFTDPNALPYDAVSAGVLTDRVRYTAQIASLIANPVSDVAVGVATEIPPKFYVYHRFAYHWEWGAVGFNEGLIFSGRALDFAYLTPLSFLKSLEHSLRDRDNSFMGVDVEYQPFAGFRAYGGFFLDDIIFGNIGKGYWSNKTAWNVGVNLAAGTFQFATEYTRVEPYTFTHFNYQNTPTHDSVIITANLPPNADRWTVALWWWWQQRYPVQIQLTSIRHGENLYDSSGTLLRNVGGDVWRSRRHQDAETVRFLDGKLVRRFQLSLQVGYEIRRQWILLLQLTYHTRTDQAAQWLAKLFLRFGDF